MPQEPQLITQRMRGYIGKEAQPRTAWGEVTTSDIRRFIQSIPDEDPVYHDERYASKSRFGGIVAPPTMLQVMLGFRPPGTRDPIIDMPDDWGGDDPASGGQVVESGWYPGMGELMAHFPKDMMFFHGGEGLEVYQLARPGDRITCKIKLVDMYEKRGRSGRLGFVVTAYTFTNQRGEVLLVNRHTEVLRERKQQSQQTSGEVSHRDGPEEREGEVATTPAPARELSYEDVTVGAQLPPKSIRLTVPLIVRWCAATEIFTRRDHYDLAYVQKHTDLKGIVAGGLWSNTYVLHHIKNWAGPEGWVWRITTQTRAHMFQGDVLTAWGKVTGKHIENGLGHVELEAGLRRQDGFEVVPTKAVVVLPVRGGRPVPYPFRP